MAESSAENEDALALIEKSGILNPSMPLKDVMELSRKVSALRPTGGKSGGVSPLDKVDYFIHRNFVLTHVEN